VRSRPRLDANQHAIVSALQQAGASVTSLAAVGNGCPDILVGIRKVTTVMEVKDGAKPPSKKCLTPEEKKWHDAWNGSKHIVESVEQALQVLAAF
jgi:phosphopantothenoylcysteine synthetase/decarboxylase